MLLKKLIIYAAFFGTLYAQNNSIDTLHDSMSDSVFEFSKFIDKVLSNNYDDFNISDSTYEIRNHQESVDSFFKTNKYLDSTEDTYLRINLNALGQTKGSNDFGYKVRARLPLSRTKQSYNLFIDDLNSDSPNSEITNQSVSNETKTTVGINYFAPKTYGIDSKYSIGISGLRPYIRARYNLSFETGDWSIEPHQILKYSEKYKFGEETILYFDRKIQNEDLLRFSISRHTQEKRSGMDYSFSTQYFMPLPYHIALSFSQYFIGNTKYEDRKYLSNNTFTTSTYGGLYNYVSSVSLRQNVWKKWFFYEITPAFNFHRQYDYKANYSVLFSVDMYFGQSYKSR